MIFAEIIIYVAFGVFFISMITKGVKKMENIRVEQAAARIKEMNGELAAVMARTGVLSLEKMDSSVIHKRDF